MSKENLPKDHLKLEKNDIKDLALIENDFFTYAIDNNKELAEVLIKPVLNYLGIKKYKIISVKSEVSYNNLTNHSCRIDCLLELEDGKLFIIEIQNGHPEELPLKRIRYEQALVDSRFLKKGIPYSSLPDIISLVYTKEPLKERDNGKPVADIVQYDLIDGEVINEYGIRTIIVNGKYKQEGFEEFTDIIEDLQKQNAEDIKNPVIKNIHLKTKNTERGRGMYSDYIEKRYGNIIRENKKLQEQLLEVSEQALKNQEQLLEERKQRKKVSEQYLKNQEQLLEERKQRKKVSEQYLKNQEQLLEERKQRKKEREELQNKNEIIQKYEKLMKEKGIPFD